MPFDAEKEYKVFNPGAPVGSTITIELSSIGDAAWIEQAIVARKRDGYLSKLHLGLLSSAISAAVSVKVTVNDKSVTPQQLHEVRMGRAQIFDSIYSHE